MLSKQTKQQERQGYIQQFQNRMMMVREWWNHLYKLTKPKIKQSDNSKKKEQYDKSTKNSICDIIG